MNNTAHLPRPILQRLRSACINTTCTLMNLNSKIRYRDHSHPIAWRDHLRWWIEGKLSSAFCKAWSGSDEELEAVIHDEVSEEYMSDRQRAFLALQNRKEP